MRTLRSEFFTLEEMTTSQTATRRGLDNTPNDEAFENLDALCFWCLDQIRGRLGRAVFVSSGFRSPIVNQAVGGVGNSQHLVGEAADIKVAGLSAREAWEAIRALEGFDFDQLILEYGRWVHVSYTNNRPNRREVWDFQEHPPLRRLVEKRGPMDRIVSSIHWRDLWPKEGRIKSVDYDDDGVLFDQSNRNDTGE